jgi:hypothetical protein
MENHMMNPDDARQRLHDLIDAMPDEQVALVWMTFQSMFQEQYGEEFGEEGQDGDELDQV